MRRYLNMAVERIDDLRAFQGFIEERFADAGASLTLNEALLHWELENQTQEDRKETLEAIRRGLADVEAGRTVDAFEFVGRMRHR
jgi:hypothetical protein